MILESGHGSKEVLLNLTSDGSMLTGEVSSPEMGTLPIAKGSVNGNALSWAVRLSGPIAMDLEFSVQVHGDTLSGEERAGTHGTSTVRGTRGTASDWLPWPGPHTHRSAVRLPDGTNVTAVSYDIGDPYRRDQPPDFGLYLDRRWAPPWEHDYLDWPDFGIPAKYERMVAALNNLLERARGG